jgi:Subtilase family
MPAVLRPLVLGVAIWLAAAGLACAAADPDGGTASPRESRQQVLVLLRLTPEHFRPNAEYGDSYGDGLGHSARQRVAARLARAHKLTLVSAWPLPLIGVDCFIMTVPAGQTPEQVAAQLSRDPGVEWSQPMSLYHAQSAEAPNDPLFKAQPAAREWRLADLHEIATGRNVLVAVIDSQIENSHPDLIGQVQISQNFVPDRPDAPEQHGTEIAGIIAAIEGNGIGIAGVAPRARLMGLRACWQPTPRQSGSAGTVCDSLSLAEALHFAIAHNVQVINLSLSGPPDLLLGRLVDVATARGVTVVGAYDRSLPGGGFPASHAGVVAVVDESPGSPIPGIVSAPGRDIPTTEPGGRWTLVNGSSFAAAHVSGLFALLHQRAPRAQSLTLVALPAGSGIDACGTLLRVSRPCDCACARGREDISIVGR